MADLEQLLALSNGMAGKGQMSDEYISQMLAKNTRQKDSFWNSPWTQIGASLLAGGTDANGIPISAGQAIGRGIQNVAAMKQKGVELDNDRLRSAIWLRQQMGADKGVWMTSPDGRKLQVKPDEVQNYQNDGWKPGEPTSLSSQDPVDITYTLPDGSRMTRKVPPGQARLMVDGGQAYYGKPVTADTQKPLTTGDLSGAYNLAKDVLGVDDYSDATPQDAVEIAEKAREMAGRLGGNPLQYIPELARKWKQKVPGASGKPNNPAKPFM